MDFEKTLAKLKSLIPQKFDTKDKKLDAVANKIADSKTIKDLEAADDAVMRYLDDLDKQGASPEVIHRASEYLGMIGDEMEKKIRKSPKLKEAMMQRTDSIRAARTDLTMMARKLEGMINSQYFIHDRKGLQKTLAHVEEARSILFDLQ